MFQATRSYFWISRWSQAVLLVLSSPHKSPCIRNFPTPSHHQMRDAVVMCIKKSADRPNLLASNLYPVCTQMTLIFYVFVKPNPWQIEAPDYSCCTATEEKKEEKPIQRKKVNTTNRNNILCQVLAISLELFSAFFWKELYI